jgi:hypothetical protein
VPPCWLDPCSYFAEGVVALLSRAASTGFETMNASRLVLSTVLSLVIANTAFAEAPANPTAVALKDFADRVKAYVDLHKKLKPEVPPLPEKAEAAQIDAHRKALAAKIQAERRGAKRKDIFTADVRDVLLPIIREEFRGREGRESFETIQEGNPAVEGTAETGPRARVKLVVNAPYPQGAPLSSVPASLLANLPKLPDELEYRFVGRDLILLDTEAQLVVDFIRRAVPERGSGSRTR